MCSILRDNEFIFTHTDYVVFKIFQYSQSQCRSVKVSNVLPAATIYSLKLSFKSNHGILQQRKIMESTTHRHVAPYIIIILFLLFSVNAYPSTLARLVFRLAMHVGNCIVLNMGSSLMVKCLVIILWDVEMIHLTPSSVRRELVNMFREQCL